MIGHRLGWAPGILPLRRDEALRFLPWLLALMVLVAVLGGIGLIALGGHLRAAARSLAMTMTLQVPAETSTARLDTVLALLRQTKGIVSAKPLEPAETARLLEPWLGPKVPLDQLPVPRLIDLRIDLAAGPDLATLRHQLSSVVPEARLDDHRSGFYDMRAAAGRIEIVLAAAIAVALGLIATSVVFSVRASLLVHRASVEVLHLLGAPDIDIARQFALRYLQLGLLGGAIGAIAALLAVLALGSAGTIPGLPAAGEPGAAVGIADWRVWGVLAGGLLMAGLIAVASAWVTVLRWLARMP
jgi:cell division transport system permease protein